MSSFQNNAPQPINPQMNTNAVKPKDQPTPMDLFQKQTKLLKKQLIHGRIRTVIMVLMLAVLVLGSLYIKSKVDEAMSTVESIYTMTQNVNSLAGEVSELTKNVSDTVATLNTDEINTVIENMSSLSESLKGTVEALDIEGLNTAVSNMSTVAENLTSVASLLNGAAEALQNLFGGGK